MVDDVEYRWRCALFRFLSRVAIPEGSGPEGSSGVLNMYGIRHEFLVPQPLHLLVEFLVDARQAETSAHETVTIWPVDIGDA